MLLDKKDDDKVSSDDDVSLTMGTHACYAAAHTPEQ